MAFWTKAVPKPEPTDAPVQPQIVYLSSGVGVAIIKWNESIAARAAMQHPIVYRALNKISEAVQQANWIVETDPESSKADRQGKTKIIEDLQQLLSQPNPSMSSGMLRYWMALNFTCYGRIPLKISTSAVAPVRPNGIYPLEAMQVRAVLNDRAVPTFYEYGTGATKEKYPSKFTYEKNPTSRGYVEQVWKPGLRGYQHIDDQNHPLGAIGLPAEIIFQLMKRAVATASGHPNVRYLVTCSRTLTEPQKKALKDHLNEDHGPDGHDSGKIPILQNAGDIAIHKLDNNLSDIHSKTPSDDMARLIFGAFGIPIALAGMGAADGAKFANNYGESRYSFWEDTIIPGYVSPIFQGLSRILCPPGVRIIADYETIPALLGGRIASMKEANGIMFLTTTEKRNLFQFAPNNALPETPIPASTAVGSLAGGPPPGGQTNE